MRPQLEIAVASDAAARLADAHGADRVELSTALELGGVTPSQALTEATLETGAETHVLVRCRAGDFVYDDDELRLMCREAAALVRAGAAGVVVGALDEAGELDLAAIERMSDAARAVNPAVAITVHRAVDASADPVRCARSLAASGIRPRRILTSGGRAAAGEATAVIAQMVAAAGPIEVMAGGGVTIAAIPALVATGVAAVHLSAKRRERDHWSIDPTLVTAARAALC